MGVGAGNGSFWSHLSLESVRPGPDVHPGDPGAAEVHQDGVEGVQGALVGIPLQQHVVGLHVPVRVPTRAALLAVHALAAW